jgi:hypothetical protein
VGGLWGNRDGVDALTEYDNGMWRSIMTGLIVASLTALFVLKVAPPHHEYRAHHHYPTPATVAIVCSVVTGLGSAVLDYLSTRKAHKVIWRRRLGLCVKCGYDMRSNPQRCSECGSAAEE